MRRAVRLAELLAAGLTVVLGWIAVLALAGLVVVVTRTHRHGWLAIGLAA